ncbi:DUF1905 domain-containing protein [Nocardia flavorosea]|uniref:DUF1905 domain-containing protein n=1 Tax=Nocardia flavorosea TaxID=53429 RepID=UPI000B2C9ED1|nr:DUF1905 domain-containing protein [Nocardia flavorosea]
MLTFDTVIELAGKTATGFRVPAPVVEELGSGKKPKVAVRIGGHTYRSTVAVYGGEYMLPLSAENRNAAGVSAGETVTVDVELDTSERTVTVPGDLAAALAGGLGGAGSAEQRVLGRLRRYGARRRPVSMRSPTANNART